MIPSFFKVHFSLKPSNRLLKALLSLDVIFIGLHALFVFLVFKRIELGFSIRPFMVNNDGGYPEIFQYLQFLIAIVFLVQLLKKTKKIGYVSWLLLFVLMLLDDSLTFHERFGAWAVEKFNYEPMFGLRALDLGELTYVGVFGSLIFLFLAGGYYYGDKNFRKTTIDLGLLFGLFLFFGIGMDMVHEFIDHNRYTLLTLILLEDGGEMIVLSLFVWYLYFIKIKPQNHNTFLHQFFFKPKSN